MSNEKTNKTRPCLHAYCTQEQKDAIEGHEMLDGCLIGQERAQRILEALDFMAKWKPRIEELENGPEAGSQARISELEQQLESTSTEHASIVADLQSQLDEALKAGNSTQQGNERLADEIKQLKEQLQEAHDQIAAIAAEEVTWQKISSTIDPAYVAVIEEITKRLKEKYELESLDPQTVLVTFFMKYYYNQEVQFSGMPFVIKPKEILFIVRQVYPDMMSGTLKQALSVK